MNFRRLVYSSISVLGLIIAAGCGSSAGIEGAGGVSVLGSNNTVTTTPSVSGTVKAVAGGGARTVSLSFNTSDGKPISSLRITSNLAALPSGWSAPSGTFSCASVKTGNGCILNLTFAPTGDVSGTLIVQYSYTNNAGKVQTGTLSIPYAATVHNNVAATASPAGQVAVLVGANESVNVNFTTDDGNPATALTLTTPLGSLPNGWTSSAASFTCAKISTGNGCQLALRFAPSTVNTGTLTLDYGYTDNSGAAKTGSVSIPYAGTMHDNVVATASPSGQVAVLVAASGAVNVNFTTDDTNTATALTLTTPLSSLPGDWSSTSSSFSCATINTGNGCQLALTYTPSAVESGTLNLAYSYTDNAGTAKTGSVNIPYAATQHDYVVTTASPTGQLAVLVTASGAVSITFNTNDGNPATALAVTSDLTMLPTGWSSTSTSFTCASVATGNGCELDLTFAPTTAGTGTLTLNYSYTDNAGQADTGSVSIPYAGTVHDNVVATASPSGTVAVNLNATQAVTVTFTTDDGNPATALSVTSDLTMLPTGWSSTSTSFTCSSVATGSSCQLSLSYAPTTADSGTLTLNYSYTDNAGTPKTGSVSIPYAGVTVHAYVTSGGTISMCSIGTDGSLSNCTATASGVSVPSDIAFSGGFAYIAVGANQTSIYSCAVALDGTLSSCGSAATGFQGARIAIYGSYLYAANRNAYPGFVTVCAIGGGSVSSCTQTGPSDPRNYTQTIAVYNGYVYVGASGSYSTPSVYVCTPNSDGTLSACSNAGVITGGANSMAAAGGYLYVDKAQFSLCTIGVNGAFSSCTPQTNTAMGIASYYAPGALASYNGFAYLPYENYTGPPVFGDEICSVGSDGTLSNCADSGGTFYSSITIH